MTIRIPAPLLRQIEADLEAAYPEEGAGLLLGILEADGVRRVTSLLPMPNRWEDGDRRRRYRLDPRDLMAAEDRAEAEGLSVLGVFHSHPDHPAVPSSFDVDQAFPFFAYLITTVEAGAAGSTRAWLLSDERREFQEAALDVAPQSEETR